MQSIGTLLASGISPPHLRYRCPAWRVRFVPEIGGAAGLTPKQRPQVVASVLKSEMSTLLYSNPLGVVVVG